MLPLIRPNATGLPIAASTLSALIHSTRKRLALWCKFILTASGRDLRIGPACAGSGPLSTTRAITDESRFMPLPLDAVR